MKTSDSLSISPNRQQANVVLEMKVCKETAKKYQIIDPNAK